MEQWPLPAGWEWKRLAEVSEINPRRPSIQRSDDAPTSFVPMAAVDEVEGRFAEIHTRPYGEVKRGYTYFEENDVVFAKITPCMENGKAAIARSLIDGFGFGTTEFHVFRPKPGVLPEWLHRYVRQSDFRREAKERFRGAVGQQRVPQDFSKDANSHPLPRRPRPLAGDSASHHRPAGCAAGGCRRGAAAPRRDCGGHSATYECRLPTDNRRCLGEICHQSSENTYHEDRKWFYPRGGRNVYPSSGIPFIRSLMSGGTPSVLTIWPSSTRQRINE